MGGGTEGGRGGGGLGWVGGWVKGGGWRREATKGKERGSDGQMEMGAEVGEAGSRTASRTLEGFWGRDEMGGTTVSEGGIRGKMA